VSRVKMGDKVKTDRGGYGVVRCVVAAFARDYVVLSRNQLGITKMHPVFFKNGWMFPRDIPHRIKSQGKEMYSFLLEPGESTAMFINHCWVAHFAHNNNMGVLHHPFYGTDAIRANFERLDPFKTGFVRIKSALRNKNGVVCGYL
jgi:Hint-domain